MANTRRGCLATKLEIFLLRCRKRSISWGEERRAGVWPWQFRGGGYSGAAAHALQCANLLQLVQVVAARRQFGNGFL